MDTQNIKCQNCEQPHKEGFEFCPYCGQKTNDELTLGVLFYNTISNYFSFDARFLKSFIPLMFKPGYLATKFLEGKRLLFLHPAQMYLFISVVFFFTFSFTTDEWVNKADDLNQDVIKSDALNTQKDSIETALDSLQIEKILQPIKTNKNKLGLKDEDLAIADSIIKSGNENGKLKTNWGFDTEKVDSLIAAGAEKDLIYEEIGMSDDAGFIQRRFFANLLKIREGRGAGAIVQSFFDSVPVAMFFLLPLFALILKLFYFNKGKYVYHLVFGFYYFSFLFMVFSLIFGINYFYDIPDGIDWLIALSTYFYFLIALIRFYKQNIFLTLIKSGAITFIFLLFVIPATFGVLAALSFVME